MGFRTAPASDVRPKLSFVDFRPWKLKILLWSAAPSSRRREREARGQARTRHSFNFYVHRPSYTDPSAVPPGEDNIMIEFPIANARERLEAAGARGLDTEEALVEAAREAVFRQFERMGYCKGAPDGRMASMIKAARGPALP